MVLRNGFEFKEGSEISVESVLSYVDFDDDCQKLVFCAVKDIFQGVTIRREDKKGKKNILCINLHFMLILYVYYPSVHNIIMPPFVIIFILDFALFSMA